MKKNLFLLVFVGLKFSVCSAQFQAEMPLAKPIPPNAAAMFKVLERPLGTYTGTIPVNFPLCSVTSGSLRADVSLNYNSTGGIRVAELPSCVGLGFSLADGGGRITQQIRGKADDMSGLLNNNYPQRPSNFNCSDVVSLDDVARNYLDLEPDEYLYNFNGRSGKFFLQENGTVVIQGNEGLKITYDFQTPPADPRIRRWIITDENGNKYYFGQNKDATASCAQENTSSYTGSTGSTIPTLSSQSWYLVEARDMNEENKLTYTYVSSSNLFTSFSGGIMPIDLRFLDCTGFNTQSDYGIATTDGTEYIVSRIDGNSGYVLFNLTQDYAYGPQKLSAVQCYDSAGNYQKQCKFNYGTFARGDWKLTSLSEFGSTGFDSLTHKFTYNELENLPSAISYDVDFWGYFNGQVNFSYFPGFKYAGGSSFYWLNALPSERHANGGYGMANILTKIIYPTGGSRSFVYEGNTVLYNENLNAYSPDPNYTTSRNAVTTDFNFSGSFFPSMVDTFTVNSTDGWTTFTYTLDDVDFSCGGSYTVNLYQTSTRGDLTGGILLRTYNGESQPTPSDRQQLLNGYYRVEVWVTPNSCTIGSCTATWNECTLSSATVSTPNGTYNRNPRTAGGVRIKEIDDYDPATGATNSTQYKYQLYSTDSTLPSGLLVSPLVLMGLENIPDCGCSYWKLFPGTTYPLASESGSFVVYPEVRTIQNGNGWVDRTFSYAADVPDGNFPNIPAMDQSGLRGQLTAEKTYTQTGTLIHSKTSTYANWGSGSQSGLRVKPYWMIPNGASYYFSEFDPNNGQTPYMGACNSYSLYDQTRLLSSTTETTIAPSGNNVITTSFVYKSYNNYNPIGQQTTTINNGQSKQVNYNYSFDTHFALGLSTSEQTMKNTLLSANYLQPLEMIDSLKPASGAGSFLDGAKYVFGYFNSSDIHVTQLRKFTTLSDSTVLNFSGFDTHGNLTEQYQTGDVRTVYLWGYGGRYLVAKVTNSTYASVTALVNLTVINNPSSDAALRTELNKIRAALAGSTGQVTTYTYSTLYGMTSSTDAAGTTTYYQYDPHGRLQFVKDFNNNIIKRYTYQFNNP